MYSEFKTTINKITQYECLMIEIMVFPNCNDEETSKRSNQDSISDTVTWEIVCYLSKI